MFSSLSKKKILSISEEETLKSQESNVSIDFKHSLQIKHAVSIISFILYILSMLYISQKQLSAFISINLTKASKNWNVLSYSSAALKSTLFIWTDYTKLSLTYML